MQQSRKDNIEPVTGAEIVRDKTGQISQKSWSCLTLDLADIFVKLGGKTALEYYYRTAQQVEAYSTGRHSLSAEEQQTLDIYYADFVNPSLREGEEVIAIANQVLDAIIPLV